MAAVSYAASARSAEGIKAEERERSTGIGRVKDEVKEDIKDSILVCTLR